MSHRIRPELSPDSDPDSLIRDSDKKTVIGGVFLKNLLLGNGINIQFGGPAYSSDFILKRIKYNSRIGKYDVLFGGKITGQEIEDVFKGLVDQKVLEVKHAGFCLF